jgi:hypothetical protein
MRPYLSRMHALRLSALLLALGLLAVPAVAQTRQAAKAAAPAGTRLIDKFDDWQAVSFTEGGQTGCYVFTRASTSTPKLPGRGDVLLTVTHRPASRDAVSISAGFPYGANAGVSVVAEGATLEFYTDKRSAFARDGRAAVAAFQKTAHIIAKSPGPKNAVVSDSFSARGFNAAYAAINKACPAK